MSEQITWTEALGRANGAHGLLVDAHKAAVIILTEPGDRGPVERYAAAFTQQYASVEYACREMAALCRAMVPNVHSEPAPRPLETILADIEAEGHGDWEVNRYESSELVYCRSRLAAPPYPFDATKEELAAWREQTERGEASGKSATEAAEARLAQIRALRAETAARVIEAVLHEQAIGETDIGDTRPVLVDPLDTIAGAFAARRMDDESAWDAVERSYAEAQERAGDEEGGA